MSDQVLRFSEIKDVRISKRKLPDRRPGVSLVLELKTKTAGVSEVELGLAPDLAIRYGQALVDLGSELQKKDG